MHQSFKLILERPKQKARLFCVLVLSLVCTLTSLPARAESVLLEPTYIQILMLYHRMVGASVNIDEWAEDSLAVARSSQFDKSDQKESEIESLKNELDKVNEKDAIRLFLISEVSDYSEENGEYTFSIMRDGLRIPFAINYFDFDKRDKYCKVLSIRLVGASKKQFWSVDRKKAEQFYKENHKNPVKLGVLLKPIPSVPDNKPPSTSDNKGCIFDAEVMEYEIIAINRDKVWGVVAK